MPQYITSTHSFKWVKTNSFQGITGGVDSICSFDSTSDPLLLAFIDDLPNPCYSLTGGNQVDILLDGYYLVALNVNLGTNSSSSYAIVQVGIEPYSIGMAPPVCSEGQDFIAFNNGFTPFNISLSPTAVVKLLAGQRLRCHILTNNDSFIYPSTGIALSLLKGLGPN
jgi:hypothetical protein